MGRSIDLTGQIFGTLTAVRRVRTDASRSMWECICTCGKTKLARTDRLRNKTTAHCGCIPSPLIKDITGNKYGYLTVLQRVGSDSSRSTLWVCVCICGIKKTLSARRLVHGNDISCGCHGTTKELVALSAIVESYKSAAKKRNYTWELTSAYAKELFTQPCHYCGTLGSNTCTLRSTKHRFSYNGIDRVDNTQGYTKDNCVPCCKFCNRAKNTYTKDEYFNYCTQVAKHQEEVNGRINTDS